MKHSGRYPWKGPSFMDKYGFWVYTAIAALVTGYCCAAIHDNGYKQGKNDLAEELVDACGEPLKPTEE